MPWLAMFCAVAIPLCDVIVHCCDLRSGASLKLSAVSPPPPEREPEPKPAQPSASLSFPRPFLKGSRTPRHRIIVRAGPSGSPSSLRPLASPRPPCTFHPASAPAPPRTISMRCKHERQEEEEGPHLGRGCPPGRCDRSFVRAGLAGPPRACLSSSRGKSGRRLAQPTPLRSRLSPLHCVAVGRGCWSEWPCKECCVVAGKADSVPL